MVVFYNFIDNQAIPYMGQPPYINWIGPFSTGIYRYKSIYFRCDDAAKNVSVKIEPQDQTIFYIYQKNPQAPTDSWDVVENVLKQQAILYPCAEDWYQLILVAKAETEGEYIVDITIDGLVYKFGASFYGENEALSINLANKGFEVPTIVSKSLYESDIYEEKTDWILLNQKYRELLSNYMDVIENKGSYKSLINSLKWFDYGKLVELREIWKYETPDGTKMFDTPVQKLLTNKLKQMLFNCAKTTYFALRQPQKIVGSDLRTGNDEQTGLPNLINTIYNWDPLDFETRNQQSLEALACTWAEDEMRLKMVLLGNFFETYFMPIHTNLIRSVVEDIFANIRIKLEFCGSDCQHEECFSESGNFDLDWDSDNEVDHKPGENPDGSIDEGTSGQISKLFLYLNEVHAIAGVPRSEPYGCAFENTVSQLTKTDYKGLPYIPIIACHELDENNVKFESTNFEDFKSIYTQQIFNGIGAIARGTFTFSEPIISGTCESNVHGEFIKTSFVENNSPQNTFVIKFLFQRPGDFVMLLRFTGQSGKKYSKKVEIHIVDNIKPDVDIYILKSLVRSNESIPNPFTADPNNSISPANNYMFARTKEANYDVKKDDQSSYQVDYIGDYLYTQYIPVRNYKDHDGAPDDAPYKTRLYTMKFSGADSYNQLQQLMDMTDNHERIFKDSVWYRIGYENIQAPEQSNWCWIQYIYNVRGWYGDFKHPNATEYYTKEIFIPELMKLEIPQKIVPDYYPIVCVPVIKLYVPNQNGYEMKKIPYSYYIDGQNTKYAWEFFSWNIQQNIQELSHNIQEPFMAWDFNQQIPRGYYTIKFKYDFGDGEKIIEKNTSFKLVNY